MIIKKRKSINLIWGNAESCAQSGEPRIIYNMFVSNITGYKCFNFHDITSLIIEHFYLNCW